MKRFFYVCFLVLALLACTADYDAFGTSGYRALSEISFEYQVGEASFYEDIHCIEIKLAAPNDSVSFDSVTLEDFKISHFASIYLVESKIKSFPSDSSALDSLAKEVGRAKKALKKGSTLKLPSSRVIYLLAVSESGASTIWKLTFTIEGEDVPVSSDSSGDEKDDSDSKSSSSKAMSSSSGEKGSSSSGKEVATQSSSSVQVKKSDDNSFVISFVDELDQRVGGDTIYVVFAQGTDLNKVVVDTANAFIHRLASVDQDPAKVKGWSKPQTFKVTAENDSVRVWVVVAETVKSSATNLTLKFKNQVSTLLKQGEKADTIVIKLKDGESLDSAKLDTFTVSAGAEVSPVPSKVKSWKSSNSFKVVAEDKTEKNYELLLSIADANYVASSEKELISISAKDEISEATVNAEKKIVVLHMASKEAMADVSVTIVVSDLASVLLASKDLRTPQKMTVTAEDGSDVEWTVSADYPKSALAKIETFELERIEPTIAPVIDEKKSTITFEVAYGTDLSEVFFKYTLSAGAKLSTVIPVDLSSGSVEVDVVAENGSSRKWALIANMAEPPEVPEIPEEKEAPRLRALKIDGHDAVVDSVEENGKWVHWVHYDNMTFLADLTNLAVSDVELSEGASISGIEDGSSYDLSRGKKVTVSNGEESLEYVIRAGYQLPNSNFDAISYDDVWNNANQTIKVVVTVKVTTAESVNIGSGKGVKLKTDEKAGKIASGSIYTADFNPNGVEALSLASSSGWPDGNELIDFGKKFNARPRYIEFLASYEGKGDSCDIYLVLENRTGDKNVNRTSTDVNKMVASAWYRSTSIKNDGRPNPDVVSVSEPDANGMTRIRMKLKYGEPYENSPIHISSALDPTIQSKTGKAIDNHMVVGTGEEPVTHIRMVFASSGDGQHYKGVVGATLTVDEMRLIY